MTNLDDGVQSQEPLNFDEGAVADAPSPVDDGEAGAEAPPEETPSYDYLDIDDDLASKYVKLKVDGEEVSVPLKEALDGYNSNSVATRRFQEASEKEKQAEQALRLQQAFQSNPGLTVQILAQNAGVSVEEFLGMTPAQQQQAVEDAQADEYVDPLEAKLAQQEQMLNQMIERQQQREADDRLAQAIGGLKQRYQIEDDQVRVVVGKALEMGVGPEMFPMIYESMAYQMQTQAQAQHTAAQEAEAERRRQAAANAQGTVATGQGASTEGQAGAAPLITSPREAALAALSELGVE